MRWVLLTAVGVAALALAGEGKPAKAGQRSGAGASASGDGGLAGFGMVGLLGTGDGGAGDGGTPFNGFVLGRPLAARGDLSKDEIKGVVKAHQGELNACYQALLGRNAGKQPAPQGTAKLQFEVAPTGKVESAAVAPGGIDDPAFVGCVVDSVRKWTFPEPRGGGPVKVTYPMKLQPPD